MTDTSSRKDLTRDRILDVAARVIRRAGYDGVGVANIMKEAGLTHGGFYAHFASRKAMLAAATHRAGRDVGALLDKRLSEEQAKGMSPFAALVNHYLSDAHLHNTELGCVVAALVCEIPRQDAEVASAGREHVLSLVERVRRCLPDGTETEQAQVIAATMVGSLQLARALKGKAGKTSLANARAFLISNYDT